MTTFPATVVIFPAAAPVGLGPFVIGQLVESQLMQGGLVVFEPKEIVGSEGQEDDGRFF